MPRRPADRRTGAGRPGAAEKTRVLLAIMGALDEKGATVSADAIANRLGIPIDEAVRDMRILIEASSGMDLYLPIYISDDDRTVTLATDGGVRGKPCRLSIEETDALLAAFDRVGMPKDHPIRATIARAYGTTLPSPDEPERIVSAGADKPNASTMALCANALLEGRSLTFSYQGVADLEPHERHVAPYGIRPSGSDWYLDGYDLDRAGDRTFRIDRMGAPRLADEGPRREARDHEQTKRVGIRFADPSLLDLLDWPQLEDLHENEDGSVSGTIAYLGGMWLVRRVCCGAGTIEVDDPVVMGQAREHARHELAALADDAQAPEEPAEDA